MKPFVILISPSNMEEAIKKFKEAGFDKGFSEKMFYPDECDCIGTIYGETTEKVAFNKWIHTEKSFIGCRHFEESQIEECINWLKS